MFFLTPETAGQFFFLTILKAFLFDFFDFSVTIQPMEVQRYGV